MMKKKMPSEGLRLGRDSGSILCDTLKKWRFRTGWGGGIHTDHPHGTHLNLKKCGEGLHVKHNVTIGINHGGIPTLGNNVYVGCGACILGNIIIGNNVKVGANCVILSDVPDNATVVGNPAYIVRLNGTKVKIKL